MSDLAPSPTVSLVNGRPTVTSLQVAEHFGKNHQHVLRSIRSVSADCPADFTASNFGLSDYTDETGRTLPLYHLTRDGFTLLAMGFTGKAAVAWKIRYIEAFNALEAAAFAGLRDEYAKRITLARSEGAKAALDIEPGELNAIGRLLRYRERGFTKEETTLVMRITFGRIEKLMRIAASLGLLCPVHYTWRVKRGV